MTRALYCCLLALAASASFAGDSNAPAQQRDSRTDSALEKALKSYPQSDANGDGILTISEARAAQKKLLGESASSQPSGEAALAARKLARASVEPAPDCPTPTFADVAYGPHERNILDFWQAKSDSATPVVVFIHGGGFVNGSKEKVRATPKVLKECLAHGVSFAAINYRYRTQTSLPEVLRDTARAIQFLRTKAGEWNLDKTRFASYGGSAGAGSSLWLGFHEDLADPDNPDPVLRESSRLSVIGANSCQCTYDVQRWREILGPPPSNMAPQGEASSRGVRNPDDLGVPEAQEDRADLDMLGMLTADDPPVYLYSKLPNTPPTDRNHYVHHPKHAIAVKEKCDQLGVESALILADTVLPEGKTPEMVMLEFFFKHLKVQ